MISSAPVFSDKDLVSIYQAIEAGFPGELCPIINFVSCYGGEGTTTISTEIAKTVSARLGHRALLIGINPTANAPYAEGLVSLTEVGAGNASISDAIVTTGKETSFDHAYLTKTNLPDEILLHYNAVETILSTLRSQYRLIIFHSSGLMTNSSGLSLSRLCDGVVLVIEAERTRAPAAKRAVQLLSDKGVKIIGFVFNKRGYYIPHWLYRWL